MCRRNDFTSTTTLFVLFPKLFPAVLPSLTCFIVLACLGFWNTRVNRGCGTYRKSRLLRRRLLRPGPWHLCVFTISSWKRRQQGFAPCCTNVRWDRWTLQCDWTKKVHPKASASRSECCSSRDHTRPLRLSFALAMILTMNARRFQRTHPLSGMGSSLSASIALTCGPEPVIGAVCIAVVGSARTGRILDAGSDREDRSSDACYVGDMR